MYIAGPKILEVISKPQIRFKGPAYQRDFASDLYKLKVLSKVGQRSRWSFLSSSNHF